MNKPIGKNQRESQRSVGAFEAKTHLSALLDDVANGEEITITKHGKPVARLVPASLNQEDAVAKAIEEFRPVRKMNLLRGLSIRKLIDDGRKY